MYNKSGRYDYQVTVLSKDAVIYCFNKNFYRLCPQETKKGIELIYKRRRKQRLTTVFSFVKRKGHIRQEFKEKEEKAQKIRQIQAEMNADKRAELSQSEQNVSQLREMIGHINDTQEDIRRKKRIESKKEFLQNYHAFFSHYRDQVVLKDRNKKKKKKKKPAKKLDVVAETADIKPK